MSCPRTNTPEREPATTGIFEATSYDEKYWQSYIKARPQYSPAFYDEIIHYHLRHRIDSVSSLAVDVGSGPGQVAEVIAAFFPKVLVSDLFATHVQAARIHLSKLVRAGRIDFAVSGGETIHEHVPSESADLVTAAECLPLMDVPAAMASFQRILKPGGTLAIWVYGRPTFVASDGTNDLDADCNLAYHGLINKALNVSVPLDFASDPSSRESWQYALDTLHSFLDNVEISESQFSHVERTYVNRDAEMTLFGPTINGLKPQYSSHIGPNEEQKAKIDRTWWRQDWGIEEIKRFVSAHLPSFDRGLLEKEELIHELKEMERAIGGPTAKRQVTWPTVLILATKT